MLRVAFFALRRKPGRLIASIGGVALALLLILSLDAIVAGAEQRIAGYIEQSGADIFVSQQGVRNLHMSSSILPTSDVQAIQHVRGVAQSSPILYMTNMLITSQYRSLAYIIGLPPGASMGGPAQIAKGQHAPRVGEVIIDQGVARSAHREVGQSVTILGQAFIISGLSQGTQSLTNSVAFITLDDFARLRQSAGTVSFVLVRVAPGSDVAAVTARIQAAVPGVTAQTRETFATHERALVHDMSADILTIMNLIGFIIGVAVMALTVYLATLGLRQEFGTLKALGIRTRQLGQVVLWQAAMSVTLGFFVGAGGTFLLAWVAPLVTSNLALVIDGVTLLQVGGLAVVIAGLAAILPVWQIAGLDPASIFRGK